MAKELDQSTLGFIQQHRVAHLATVGPGSRPFVVPVCYAFDGDSVYSAIDQKPKSVAPGDLKRVRNIETNSNVSLVVDDYSDDWDRLRYVQIAGNASIVWPPAAEHTRAVEMLREKYPQYNAMDIDQRPIIKIVPVKIKSWRSR
jgi:PPOX class probable F420-dependent enzyme